MKNGNAKIADFGFAKKTKYLKCYSANNLKI
jgi:hypothetical protein